MLGILTYTQIVTLDLSWTIYAAWPSVCLSIPFSSTNSKIISYSINLKPMEPSPQLGSCSQLSPGKWRRMKWISKDSANHIQPASTFSHLLPFCHRWMNHTLIKSWSLRFILDQVVPASRWLYDSPPPFLTYLQNIYFPLCARSWASLLSTTSSFMALDTIHGPETSKFAL